MLGLLIGFGIFAIMFVLYCCCIIAGQADDEMEEHLKELKAKAEYKLNKLDR